MLWLGYVDPAGYGKFGLIGRTERAHRVSYVLAYGEIPEGLEIDHVKANGCTNKHCVAPLHLEAVTHGENNRRAAAAKTHCPAGHEYSEENTHRRPSGGRRCRACNRLKEAERYRRTQHT